MTAIQFEQLSARSLAEGKFDKAIVPLGSCESHGDHLPFGSGMRMRCRHLPGKKMRDVLVDCLVGFLKRMDEQNWTIRTREG